jgi:hypothetical protein
MAGIGTGIGRIASSAAYNNQLSTELTNDIEQVAKSVMTMQDHLDSLASVVLQNPKPERVGFTHCRKGMALSFLK